MSTHPTRTPARFGVRLVHEPDRDVLLLRGPLDILAALWLDQSERPELRRHACVVIDCADVTFIDGAGIGALVRLLEGSDHRLVNVPAKVERLLRLVDLAHLVDDRAPRPSITPAG